MMTVKEISNLTGISVRTLHYYDEIGLLRPTLKSEAGYRLYDDKALRELQQILFFREFDIPLKTIIAVMRDPALDRNRILRMQREMLVAKAERIGRLIASIDDSLKGGEPMDFQVFTKSEIESLWQTTADRMPDFMRESVTEEFGGMDQWKQHYIQRASREDMQKGYRKMVEWYGGDKDSALDAMTNPPGREVADALMKRVDAVLQKLAARKGEPIDSFAVREVIGEYGFVMKRFYQMQDEKGLMLAVAASYRDARAVRENDLRYGEGTAAFFAEAIEAFYGRE